MFGMIGFMYCSFWGMSLIEFVEHCKYLSEGRKSDNEVMHSQIARRVTRHNRILPTMDQVTEDELFVEC